MNEKELKQIELDFFLYYIKSKFDEELKADGFYGKSDVMNILNVIEKVLKDNK